MIPKPRRGSNPSLGANQNMTFDRAPTISTDCNWQDATALGCSRERRVSLREAFEQVKTAAPAILPPVAYHRGAPKTVDAEVCRLLSTR